MREKFKKTVRTNLKELFGIFAYNLQETPIRYLVTGPSDHINIFDLNNIKAECDYDFDLNKIGNINSFEYHHVRFVLKAILSDNDRHVNYGDIAKMIKTHFMKNNSSDVISYLSDNYKLFKDNYKFIKYDNGVQTIIYSPGSNLIVKLEEDTDLHLFSNLETEYDKMPDISSNCKSISIEQYKVLLYCINRMM